jgi:hypothetical protein
MNTWGSAAVAGASDTARSVQRSSSRMLDNDQKLLQGHLGDKKGRQSCFLMAAPRIIGLQDEGHPKVGNSTAYSQIRTVSWDPSANARVRFVVVL